MLTLVMGERWPANSLRVEMGLLYKRYVAAASGEEPY